MCGWTDGRMDVWMYVPVYPSINPSIFVLNSGSVAVVQEFHEHTLTSLATYCTYLLQPRRLVESWRATSTTNHGCFDSTKHSHGKSLLPSGSYIHGHFNIATGSICPVCKTRIQEFTGYIIQVIGVMPKQASEYEFFTIPKDSQMNGPPLISRMFYSISKWGLILDYPSPHVHETKFCADVLCGLGLHQTPHLDCFRIVIFSFHWLHTDSPYGEALPRSIGFLCGL